MASGKDPVGSVLVVGGGIGGIQSALDLAESGYRVYLVERSPSIGGTMAQLDKTFPTNDCAMCILGPKLVECSRHLNIENITYAEVESLEGEAGNFTARIRKLPRYIDPDKCTGCGECAENCPVVAPSEFDQGLGERKAIYRPFPQASPNVFTIEKRSERRVCELNCPAGCDAQGYIALAAEGKYREALALIKETVPLPGVMGRICVHPCETACRRSGLDEAVNVAGLKRFIADQVPPDQVQLERGEEKGERVAIVGSGPAGLSCAYHLALDGYRSTVYEALPVAGGMLAVGIPEYRLPMRVLQREIEAIEALGVEIRTSSPVDAVDGLLDDGYSAVFVATGAPKGRSMGIPGEDLDGVMQGVDFLRQANLLQYGCDAGTAAAYADTASLSLVAAARDDGADGAGGEDDDSVDDDADGTDEGSDGAEGADSAVRDSATGGEGGSGPGPDPDRDHTGVPEAAQALVGRRVAVVGGGNVAMDAAGTALRLGAEEVRVLYRRSQREMPALEEEVEAAHEEGVEIDFLVNPVEVLGRDGRVTGLKCVRMRLGSPDRSGRRRPEPIEGSEFELEVDTVIECIGQEVDLSVVEGSDLEIGDWTVDVDPETLATSREGVFAGGDLVTGPAVAVDALAAGRRAAESIKRYLEGEPLSADRDGEPEPDRALDDLPQQLPRVGRRELPELDPGDPARTSSFTEVKRGLDEEEAREEARRCLDCAVCSECGECIRACEAEAIDHDQEPEYLDVEVGAVVLSPGFDESDPEELYEYGYSRFENVVSSIEFERILSASGPYGGDLIRPSDGRHPERIAWIQCVGSRDEKNGCGYCSSVCCTYAVKEAEIAQEHAPGELETTIFFMDMRTHGKDFEAYYERGRDEYGINFVRSRVYDVRENGDGSLVLRYTDEEGRIADDEYDMVVLSVGLRPPRDADGMARVFGLGQDGYGFSTTRPFQPVSTTRPGVFACGAFNGPKDIPETVMQASAAAGEASAMLAEARKTETREKEYPEELDVSGEPRIGVFVCHCGINIGGVVDVPAVAEYARGLPHVVLAEDNLYTCSQDTQELIRERILEHNLNRVVVASCTPRTHEPLFQETIREAGLNPYLFHMANIRDQCSWVHMHNPEAATRKSRDLVRAAVARAALLEPLPEIRIGLKKNALVIGGGVSGLTAALNLEQQGFVVDIVEREEEPGGNARHLHSTLEGRDVREYLDDLIRRVRSSPRITLHTGAEIVDAAGYVGNFTSTIRGADGGEFELEHGVTIIATGAAEYEPEEGEYGYGHERVLTARELEAAVQDGDGRFKDAERIGIIHCVGSRCDDRPYCSRVCCSQAVKNAIAIKERAPEKEVYLFYRDLRTYGFREEYYRRARQLGVNFVRYEEGQEPRVSPDGNGGVTVSAWDPILDESLEIGLDLLGLATGIVPDAGAPRLAQFYKVPLNDDRFFLEAHVKLRPVDFATDGVFLAGLAHAPKTLEESIAQAEAAASRATTLLTQDELAVEGWVSQVNTERCSGCEACIEVCPYSAVELDEEDGLARVNEVLCKGCGACTVACRSGAIDCRGFTNQQLLEEVDAACL